jgi:hypothetical protein
LIGWHRNAFRLLWKWKSLVIDIKDHSELLSRIYAFGKIEDACSLEVVVHESLNRFAQEIHAAPRSYMDTFHAYCSELSRIN